MYITYTCITSIVYNYLYTLLQILILILYQISVYFSNFVIKNYTINKKLRRGGRAGRDSLPEDIEAIANIIIVIKIDIKIQIKENECTYKTINKITNRTIPWLESENTKN